jgi:hypothetical protein
VLGSRQCNNAQLPAIKQAYLVNRHGINLLTCGASCTRLHPLLQADLLGTLTRAELQDLLLVAVNLQQRTSPAKFIIEYDLQHEQLLYASRRTGAQPATSSDSSHNTSCSSSSSSSSGMCQLVEHLITTAIIRRHGPMAAILAITPPAQQLSEHAISQLLYLSLHLDGPAHGADSLGYQQPGVAADDTARGIPSFAVLTLLSGGQAISSSSLVSLMQLAAKQSRFRQALILFQLQLTPQQLCDVLLELLPDAYGGDRITQQRLLLDLVALLAAKQLPAGAAVQLAKRLINDAEVWGGRYAEDLAPLQLGSQLTGTEALQLLQAAARSGSRPAVNYALALSPAMDEIEDGEGFAAFLQAVLQHVGEHQALASEIMCLPVVQRLQPDAVFSVIECGIRSWRDGIMAYASRPCVCSCLMQYAAVSSFSTAMLQQQLLEAAAQQRLEHVAELLQAPAAAQLSVQVVGTLLEHSAAGQQWLPPAESGRKPKSSSELLLALPAVQQLPAEAVTRILAAAVKAGHVSTIRRVCSLAAAWQQQASREAAISMLQHAAHGHYNIWVGVLQGLPQLAGVPCDQLQPTRQQLQRFLQGAVIAGDSESTILLCRYAAAGGLPPSNDHDAIAGMQELLVAAVRQLQASHNSITGAAAAQLFQLSAAQARLVECCIHKQSAEGVQLVGLLPAAQQLDQQVCKSLVHAALTWFDKPVLQLGTQAQPEQVLRNVLLLPAVQRLGHVFVIQLLVSCMHLENYHHQLLLLLHSALPAAQQAAQEPATVKQLLLSAFALHRYETFNWLKQLPAAPVDDAEVAMWCAVTALGGLTML